MADGMDCEGVDGVGYDDAFSVGSENGVACKGGDAEFGNGIVGDSVGGNDHAQGVGGAVYIRVVVMVL